MLACEENLKLHLSQLSNYSDGGASVTGVVPMVATSSFTRDTGNLVSESFYDDIYSGETMPDTFGLKRDFTRIGSINYYQLRKLSTQLFTENMYASAVIDRMSINVINNGLRLESDPSSIITKMSDDQTVDWTEKTEELFALWSKSKDVSDNLVHNLAALENVAYREALIEGDILKIVKFDKKSGLPKISLISGRHVQTAMNSLDLADKGNKVIYGVEVNKDGKHIAYHVVQDNEFGINFEAVRILARGRTSSRDTATLIYNEAPRNGVTRGFPFLTRILQSLAQIGRYATLELKAAEVNASLAMVVEKGENVAGSRPLGGPTMKGDPTNPDDPDELPRQRVYGGQIVNELAWGEVIKSFDTKRPNVNFAAFKKTILQDIAFCKGIPPEVFMLMFENSFSASRQATIEFKSVVSKEREYFSGQFNQDVYGQWLLGMVLETKIDAPGYVTAFKTGEVFGLQGWQKSKWKGFIKQNVDILKEAKAYKEYIDEGLMDRDQAASEITGADHRTVVKRLKKQNKALAEARDPLLGEINTSISRVEKDEPKGKDTDPKEPQPRKQAAKKKEAALMETIAMLIEERDGYMAELQELQDFGDVDDIDKED